MKTIWITGGSSGIGAATAKKFVENNWRVIISSRSKEKLENSQRKIFENLNNHNIYYVPCDISNRTTTHKTVKYIEKNIAPIDLALLNAAAYEPNKAQKFNIKISTFFENF